MKYEQMPEFDPAEMETDELQDLTEAELAELSEGEKMILLKQVSMIRDLLERLEVVKSTITAKIEEIISNAQDSLPIMIEDYAQMLLTEAHSLREQSQDETLNLSDQKRTQLWSKAEELTNKSNRVMARKESLMNNPAEVEEMFAEAFRDTLVSVSALVAYAIIGILAFAAVSVTLGLEEATAMALSVGGIEAIPGLGGGASLLRFAYFLITMGLPMALSENVGKKSFLQHRVTPIVASLGTSFDGGYAVAPFLRFSVQDPILRDVVLWNTKRQIKSIPAKTRAFVAGMAARLNQEG